MKTKLLAVLLLAGTSIFAQTRYSIGGNSQGYDRGYMAAPAPFSHTGNQVSGPSHPRGDDNRYQNQSARNGDDRSFKRDNAFGFGQVGFEDRDSDRNQVRGHAQNFQRDDRISTS